MSDDIDCGQAYPAAWGNHEQGGDYVHGMSLRDWFAGQALAGLASNCTDAGLSTWLPDSIAVRAYDYADAMIDARAKGGAA